MFIWRVYEFSFDFGWISGKNDKISKSGQFQGPMSRRRDPMQQRKSTPRRGMSTSQCGREGGLDKLWVRRGVARVHRGVARVHRGVARVHRGVARVHRGVAKLRRSEGLRRRVAVLRRGAALFIDMCFCHVFLFHDSADLSIRLMKTL